MAVFIEARTEQFQQDREEYAERVRQREGTYPVRRPLRGYQLKADTYATIRIMGPTGFLPVIDAAGDWRRGGTAGTTHYTNFFVQQVAEERHEKQQVVDTFGESFIFFFGEAPRLLQVQGLLLNTADFTWRAEFWHNYDIYFRGTKLVELGARLYLIYDDRIVEGYMISAQATENEASLAAIPFGFQLFVTGQTELSLLGDPDFPVSAGKLFEQTSSYDAAMRVWQQSRVAQRALVTPAVQAAAMNPPFGTGRMLSSLLRGQIINAGDPSITGFVQRASAAMAPFLGGGLKRTKPLRSTLRENVDEMIGGTPELSAEELAAPLAANDQWLMADRMFDLSLGGMMSTFDGCAREFVDTMGRIGRAVDEIREAGGPRSRSSVSRGVALGDAAPPRPPLVARNVPFGMSVQDGLLL